MARLGERGQASRPRRLDGAPLDYEPLNELGVVFLFSHLARRRFGLRVATIRAGFPDCIAYRGEKRVRIEFEYRSRAFAGHGYDPQRVDCIVCWIHDWTGVPARIRVIELRKEFGLGFNVWVNSWDAKQAKDLEKGRYFDGGVAPPGASKGDLVMYYEPRPHSYVRHVFRVTGQVRRSRADWNKSGIAWRAPVRRVCLLKSPLYIEEMRAHPILRNAGFVRGFMRGSPKVTAHWPEILTMILGRNPSLRKTLAEYGPQRV